jgi:hypothetical protein
MGTKTVGRLLVVAAALAAAAEAQVHGGDILCFFCRSVSKAVEFFL